MQDLGNINITIRGGTQGGVTGSGQPGGGPGLVPSSPSAPGRMLPTPAVPPPPPPLPTPGVPAGDSGAAVAPPSLFQRILQRLQTGSEIRGEIGQFVSSPSVGGLAQLGQASSTTGTALASLSRTIAAAGPIAIGVLAAVGAAVIGIKMLKAASEMTARRIEETMRFSGALQIGAGVERFREFQRTLADLNRNGAAYVQSQRLATMVNDAHSAAMTEMNGVIAEAGMMWQKMELAFWSFLNVLMKGVNGIKNFLGISTEQMLLMTVNPTIGSMYSWLKEPLQKLVEYVAAIMGYSKPKPGANINDWFMGDLAAMTRRPDAYNPRRGRR